MPGRLVSLLMLLLAFSISAFSQTPSQTISVSVKDPNGDAIAGATVVLTVRNFQNRTSVTGSDGAARFENVESGDHRVSVTAPNFPSVIRDLGTADGAIDVVLSPGGISENVTVTATRTQISTEETAVPVTVLGREQLDRRPVNTVGDLFRELPGTSTVNEGAFQVRPRIRGLESNRILILVDGERLNNARTSTGQSGIESGLVDLDQIESIEVVRGSGSVLYGTDALAGTINIITKDTPRRLEDGFRFGAMFNGYFSSNELGRRGNLAVTGSSKFFAFRVAQSLERFNNYYTGKSDGVVPAEGLANGVATDGEVGNSQSHGGNTQITTRFFFNDNNDLKLNYERRRGSSIGSPLLTPEFGFAAFFPYSNRDKFNGRFETRNINQYLASVSGTFYYQDQKRNFTNITPPFLPFFNGSFSETITDTNSAGFDVQSNWVLGSRNFLTSGVSFFRDENQDTRLSQAIVGTIVPNRTTSVPRADLGSFAFFAQDEHNVTRRLKLTGGVRVERFFMNSQQTEGFSLPLTLTPAQIEILGVQGLDTGATVRETAVTGDFGAVFRLTDAVSLTGRIGRSFRIANLFERFFTGAGSIAGSSLVGNPNLKPESGINFDAGVKVRTARLGGSFSYFNNDYRDFLSTSFRILIPRVVGGPATQQLFQTVNFGRVRLQGFEAELEVPLKIGGLGFLTPNGNISYLRGENLESGEPFNVTPPLKTVLNLRWNDAANRYYGEFQTRIVNKQNRLSTSFLAANLGPEPGFAVSDIRGGYFFRRERFNLSVNVGITNIFDRYYNEQFILAPAKGRSLVIGTTWEIR